MNVFVFPQYFGFSTIEQEKPRFTLNCKVLLSPKINDMIQSLSLKLDNSSKTGIIFLLISFLLFISTKNVFEVNFDIFSGVFFANFLFVWIYLVVVIANNKKTTGRYFRFAHFRHNILLLQLFNISAYSLNRSLPVFNISTSWVVWFLMLSNLLLILHAFFKKYDNKWWHHAMLISSSIGIFFHFYQTIYIAQILPFSILGFWFFGIPLHAFVPILFLWAHIKVVYRYFDSAPSFWPTSATSWASLFAFLGYFGYQFKVVNDTIGHAFHEENKPYVDEALPSWVNSSQHLKKNWITKKVLKSGLAYTNAKTVRRGIDNFGGRINERIKHDPLVVFGSFVSGGLKIPTDERINILNYLFDTRHQTERKLWSGENLSTTDIITNVQLFPSYRIAYTEKTFNIKNTKISRFRRQQEALYTFYIPEGSVVTSASLWIEGKERPAYLTTKEKADSAYTTIVGRERRDPLLLHWKEGNRITVRVFPCTPEEDRQFKIGITTPLKKEGDRLVYENIDFQGPDWKKAKESINVVSEGKLVDLDTPFSFKQDGLNYEYSGRYYSDWTMDFEAVPLSNTPFTFNGKSFQIQPHEIEFSTIELENIYLDINKGWTKKEFKTIWENAKNKKIWVYTNNRMMEMTEDNKKSLFKSLRKQNFTLFPFQKIQSTDKAIVISKYNSLTPTLSDIGGSGFVEQMSKSFLTNKQPIRLFNIGKEISPYLRTLKEFRSVQYNSGSASDIATAINSNNYFKNQEDENTVVNHYGGFTISKSITTEPNSSEAPDHLMRLFAYNNLLREVGKNYFNKKELAKILIDEAKEANVVTPISSLIVLETQKDYDRFDIKQSKNSLKNASIGNSGAVPEPHEWLLIILVLGLLSYLQLKKMGLIQPA